MREIISLSLGKHSNHIASHFWNAQDEQLKVQPEPGKEQMSELEMEINRGTHMVYQELESTRQLLPRHIYIDFNDNFGNYSACFYGKDKADKQQIQDEYTDNWQIQEQQQNEIPLSKFQAELMNIDDLYGWNQEYEQNLQQEEEEYNEAQEDILDQMRSEEEAGLSGKNT